MATPAASLAPSICLGGFAGTRDRPIVSEFLCSDRSFKDLEHLGKS
ncbi:MAG: hypothetical protein LH647_21560 [Leptolyngbyaceae cyanobacterium CAN_BIN12]|nr:hypothetical protein [Leptolyngbyaceae cyanobacterium CAN_BIN12]